MSIEIQTDVFSEQDTFDLNQVGFKLAVGVMDYDKRVPLDDTSRIRWNIFLEERKNLGIVKQTPLKIRICTEEDYKEFYPVVS